MTVIFSFLGVWSIELSPINYSDPSASSVLNTLIVPFGSGIPKWLVIELLNYILFEAFWAN